MAICRVCASPAPGKQRALSLRPAHLLWHLLFPRAPPLSRRPTPKPVLSSPFELLLSAEPGSLHPPSSHGTSRCAP